MRTKKISSALAIILMAFFAVSFIPRTAAAEEVRYDSELAQDGQNTMQFTKALEIDDTADIPDAEFSFAVSGLDQDIAAVYDEDDGSLISYGIKAGVGADKIGYSIVTVSGAGGSGMITDNAEPENSGAAEFTEDDSGFTIRYKKQAVDLPQDNETAESAVDNTVIRNLPEKSENGPNTYYAEKTVELDFSDCGFDEPGIYRYYIEESGDNDYIINDYNNEGTAVQGLRTVDVVVVDDTSGDDYKLKIDRINMYTGKITTGIDADGKVIGQPAKNEGMVNYYYAPHDITIGKRVSGNQGSRNKFFKFSIKLAKVSGANAVNDIDDDDVFYISSDSTLVRDESYKDSTDRPNIATQYTKKAIYDANHVAYFTGKDLKSETGCVFYLQHGQYVTIQGIPAETGYTVTEWPEDYTPTVQALDGSDDRQFDNTNESGIIGGPANNNFGTGGLTVGDASPKTASVTDNEMTDDVCLTFQNEREGKIPTGVIVSVAVPALIGLGVIGGLISLGVRRRREDDEDEED